MSIRILLVYLYTQFVAPQKSYNCNFHCPILNVNNLISKIKIQEICRIVWLFYFEYNLIPYTFVPVHSNRLMKKGGGIGPMIPWQPV